MKNIRKELITILILFMYDFTCLAEILLLATIINFMLEKEGK